VSEPPQSHALPIASRDEMLALAGILGAELRTGDLLLLEGDLGAGKTTFVQGLARGMGLSAAVKSPSFTLVHEYRAIGRAGLGHLDLYRMPEGRDLGDLGLDDLLARGAVAVEWGGRLFAGQPEALLLTLRGPGADEAIEQRLVTVACRGDRSHALAAAAAAWASTSPDE
jgi:tRNA threonylcarbamoyladenosine biosynthesis protein TsaE